LVPTLRVYVRPTAQGVGANSKALPFIRLEDGTKSDAELHWYEARGIGKKEMKVKELLRRCGRPDNVSRQ
jgi:hypothetical protein